MTWTEWINSDYCEGIYYANDYSVTNSYEMLIVSNNGVRQTGNTVIVDSLSYFSETSG